MVERPSNDGEIHFLIQTNSTLLSKAILLVFTHQVHIRPIQVKEKLVRARILDVSLVTSRSLRLSSSVHPKKHQSRMKTRHSKSHSPVLATKANPHCAEHLLHQSTAKQVNVQKQNQNHPPPALQNCPILSNHSTASSQAAFSPGETAQAPHGL